MMRNIRFFSKSHQKKRKKWRFGKKKFTFFSKNAMNDLTERILNCIVNLLDIKKDGYLYTSEVC
jgi:hypothetical protein